MISRAMGALGFCLLALACAMPLGAQTAAGERASVGQGAPRSTFAYVSANPQKLRALAGHDGERFTWMPAEGEGDMPPEARQMIEYINSIFENASHLDMAMIDGRISDEGPMPAMYMDFTLQAGFTPDVQPEFFNGPVEEGMLEITVEEINGTMVNRYRIMERKYNYDAWDEKDWDKGAEAKPAEGGPHEDSDDGAGSEERQMGPDDGMDGEGEDMPEEPDYTLEPVLDIYTLQQGNHFYVATFYSVIERLVRGLGGSDLDGESLADFRRFAQWYNGERTGAAVEVWINAYELRRWVERVQPGEMKSINDLASPELDMRNWTQVVMTMDYDEAARDSSMSISVASRKPIPALEKLNFPVRPNMLARYIPDGALAVGGMHFGDPTGLYARIKEDLREIVNTQAEADRKRQAEWEAEERRWEEEDSSPKEGFGGGDKEERQMGPDDPGMDEPMGPDDEMEGDDFDRAIEELNKNLGEMDADLDTVLEIFNGSMAGFWDRALPGIDNDMEPGDKQPIGLVLGLRQRQRLIDLVENFIGQQALENPDREFITRYKLNGLPGYQVEDDFSFVVAEDAMLCAFHRNQDRARDTLTRMVNQAASGQAGDGASVLKSVASGVFQLNIGKMLHGKREIEVANSTRLHPDAEPMEEDSPANHIDPNANFTFSLTHDVTSFTFSMKAHALNFGTAIDMGMIASEWDQRESYARDQLYDVGNALQEYSYANDSYPESLDVLLESEAIRLAHLQSPYDKRFENSDQLSWFNGHGLDDEWNDGDPSAEAARAAEKKGFVSYTYVGAQAMGESDFKIAIYQTNADAQGGRYVVYANGQVGWLHDAVWGEALEHIKNNTPIITEDEYYDWHGDSTPPRRAEPGNPGGDKPAEGPEEMPREDDGMGEEE